MHPRHIEGLKQGLKYAFTTAVLFEGLEMLHALSLHVQPLPEWEIGAVLGVGVGISGYVSEVHNLIASRSADEVAKLVKRSDGKVKFLHSDLTPEP